MATFKICEVAECDNRASAKSLCPKHYARWLRHGSATGGRPSRRTRPRKTCTVTGCGQDIRARGVCYNHYKQWEYHGFSTDRLPRIGTLTKTRRITPLGYIQYYDPTNPTAFKSGFVLEHRAIMAERLGRSLLPGENVHHINGDRADNRPENLELWVTSQPAGQRPEDLVTWAREILARYGPPERRP